MLIRPKSASRTRTLHVESRVPQNGTENITNEEVGTIDDSGPMFDDVDITEDDTFPAFGTKLGILREEKELPNDKPTKEQHRKNAKRSISSQDYTGIF